MKSFIYGYKRDIKRGGIYMCSLPREDNSFIHSGRRPVVVVQNDIGNCYSPTTIVVPMSASKNNAEKTMPTHVRIKYNEIKRRQIMFKETTIMYEQILTIDKRRLEEQIGWIDLNEEKHLKGITASFGINKKDILKSV